MPPKPAPQPRQTTSQKHRIFAREPIGGKKVTELPGIGQALGSRLSAQGLDTAAKVFGKFMLLADEEEFKTWLKTTAGANARQQDECARGLSEWSDNLWIHPSEDDMPPCPGPQPGPNTSQKHRSFVNEPMSQKKVTDLPGIGEVLGSRLAAKGFDTASKVFGQFMIFKNEEVFKDWLKITTRANAKQQEECTRGLSEWRNNFWD